MNEPQPMPLEQARKVFPPIWVIYERPRDYPTGYVVRIFWGMTPDPTGYRFAHLDQCREHAVAQGASVPLDRADDDQPHIVECWI